MALTSLLTDAECLAGGVQGARVQRGDVVLSQDGNRLVVRASNGAIIEYDRFSIAAGEVVQFVQPDARSRVLNRVTGGELSRIDGTLLSNGIVYLVNPQGVRVGSGAVVNVGAFYAAAGAIADQDFVQGRDRFTGLTGEVVNEGRIEAGAVALVGQYVANRGTIRVEDGVVAFAAGDAVHLQCGSGPILVRVERGPTAPGSSVDPMHAAISNTGIVDAGKGSVRLASGDFYALAMDLSGTIIGRSIEARGGQSGVVSVSGVLDASQGSGHGGSVDLFGERVGLFGGARVSADGPQGGGSIRVGGDVLGSNASEAPHADRVFMSSDAVMTADATTSGDGGKVVLWSDAFTAFLGSISARGAGAGDGGFVETSSRQNLVAAGLVDTGSAGGRGGLWLLDPTDVTVGNVDANMTAATPFQPTAAGARIRGTSIEAALATGDVVLQTTQGFDAGQPGNITFAGNGDIVIDRNGLGGSDRTFTVNAAGSIIMQNGFVLNNKDGSRALNVNLNAGAGGAVSSATAAIDLQSGSSITTGGGNLAIQNTKGNAGTIASSIDLGLGSFAVDMSAAGASLNQGAGSLVAHDATWNVTGGSVTLGTTTLSGDLVIRADGPVTDGGNITVTGAALLSAGADHDITLDSARNDFGGAVTVTSVRNLTLVDRSALVLGACATSGNLSLSTDGEITQVGDLSVAGATNLSATRNHGISLASAGNRFGGSVLVGSGHDVTVAGTGAIDLGASTVSGNLSVTASGAITDSGVLDVTGTTTLAAGATNDITLDAANSFGGAVSVTTGRDVTLNATGPLALGPSNVSGSLSITADGAITDSGTLLVSGATTLAAGATHGITLDDAGNAFGGTLRVISARNVTLNSTGALDLGASTVSGNLTLTTAGAVTDSGAILVIGATNVGAGPGNDISLDDPGNDFGGHVTISSGRDVSLRDSNAIILDASTISGDLSVTANGAITDAGVLQVAGTTTLAAGAANDITLDRGHALVGAVSVRSGRNVTLNSTVTLDLGASTMSGNLGVTAAGAITDSGNLTIVGATTLAAGAGNDITLDAANSFGGAVSVASGRNVVLRDSGSLLLGNLALSGELMLDCGTAPGDAIVFPALAGTVQATAVRLNTRAVIASAGQATIVSLGDIAFRTDVFEMGQNHKFTAFGDLSISGLATPRCTSARLGDITTLGGLRVGADAITLLGRPATQNLTAQGGWISDPSIDFVAGGRIGFSVAPGMGGVQPSNRAAFSSPAADFDEFGTLGAYTRTTYPTPLTRALLLGPGGQALDLVAAAQVRVVSRNPATFVPPPMAALPSIGLLGSAPDASDSDDASTTTSSDTAADDRKPQG